MIGPAQCPVLVAAGDKYHIHGAQDSSEATLCLWNYFRFYVGTQSVEEDPGEELACYGKKRDSSIVPTVCLITFLVNGYNAGILPCFWYRTHRHRESTSFDIYLHKSKYKYNYTYINIQLKCSIPPHIDICMRIPMHVSGLLISLWEPANSLFLRDKEKKATIKLRTKTAST